MHVRQGLLRRVDRLLDLGALHPALAQHYSPRGRPSVDPELLIRMALVDRIYAIPSERRMCEELRYNLAYRWFCRLPVGAAVPHHSTFSKNRHGRFRDAGVFRLLFGYALNVLIDTPAGKGLGHGGFDHRTGAHIYIARASNCQACLLRSQCTGGRLRRVTHSADKGVRDLARAEMQTDLYKRSMRLRRGVERVFADAKTKRGLTRLHLRGIRGSEEFQVAAAVSNLLLLARPAARAPRPGRARAVHRRVSDMERVSRNRNAAPAMQAVAELLSSATLA